MSSKLVKVRVYERSLKDATSFSERSYTIFLAGAARGWQEYCHRIGDELQLVKSRLHECREFVDI